MGYIYMIRNLINGKIYFGQTTNTFSKRYHKNLLKNTHVESLKEDLIKYGINSFEIVEDFDKCDNLEDLTKLENLYIIMYETYKSDFGYNTYISNNYIEVCNGNYKCIRSQIARELWQDEVYREKVVQNSKQGIKDYWDNPNNHVKRSESTKEKWKDSQYRENHSGKNSGRAYVYEVHDTITGERKEFIGIRSVVEFLDSTIDTIRYYTDKKIFKNRYYITKLGKART